jgi:hypothetical protein
MREDYNVNRGKTHSQSQSQKKKKAFRPTYFPPSDSILFPFDILIMVQKFTFFLIIEF